MAYNVIHTSKYLLTCFQYKTKDTEYKQLSRNQVFEELITRIYAITTGEVDLEKLVKRPPKKKKKNVQKIVVNVNEE